MDNSSEEHLISNVAAPKSRKFKKQYKTCAVPLCDSNAKSYPDKLFFNVPQGNRRKKWYKAMRSNYKGLYVSKLYICENHFDLEEDVLDWMRFKISRDAGIHWKLNLKPHVLPHKFDCQPDRKRAHSLKERSVVRKRTRQGILNEIFKPGSHKRSKKTDVLITDIKPEPPDIKPNNLIGTKAGEMESPQEDLSNQQNINLSTDMFRKLIAQDILTDIKNRSSTDCFPQEGTLSGKSPKNVYLYLIRKKSTEETMLIITEPTESNVRNNATTTLLLNEKTNIVIDNELKTEPNVNKIDIVEAKQIKEELVKGEDNTEDLEQIACEHSDLAHNEYIETVELEFKPKLEEIEYDIKSEPIEGNICSKKEINDDDIDRAVLNELYAVEIKDEPMDDAEYDNRVERKPSRTKIY